MGMFYKDIIVEEPIGEKFFEINNLHTQLIESSIIGLKGVVVKTSVKKITEEEEESSIGADNTIKKESNTETTKTNKIISEGVIAIHNGELESVNGEINLNISGKLTEKNEDPTKNDVEREFKNEKFKIVTTKNGEKFLSNSDNEIFFSEFDIINNGQILRFKDGIFHTLTKKSKIRIGRVITATIGATMLITAIGIKKINDSNALEGNGDNTPKNLLVKNETSSTGKKVQNLFSDIPDSKNEIKQNDIGKIYEVGKDGSCGKIFSKIIEEKKLNISVKQIIEDFNTKGIDFGKVPKLAKIQYQDDKIIIFYPKNADGTDTTKKPVYIKVDSLSMY
ncbi:MAG: hypothetical protein Q9M94_00520 [Candidatus Gracilibacteria bacterium]|nr:hypothetical protein [Candidatus Gracilibacteria bacterium]